MQRIGDTVRRRTGPWTPTVHTLLQHLETVGFAGAPRVLGIDEEGREILSFLAGAVAMRPWPPVLRADRGVIAMARLLRQYHEAVSSFTPGPDAHWRVPDSAWQPGMIVRHGDFAPWNAVWQGEGLVGVIDWDLADPGYPLEDVAQLAWYVVPLRSDEHCEDVGFDQTPDLRQRLRVLCETYGALPAEVLSVMLRLQAKERQRIVEFGQQGLEPWVTFRTRGYAEQIAAESAWLERHRHWLVAE